jgi:two-component system LytT family sensor kinase
MAGEVWRRGWFRFAIILLVWTVLGIFFTGQVYYSELLSERAASWTDAAKSQMVHPYLWALATPVILWLAGRFPVEQPRWKRNLALHLLVGTLCAILVAGIYHVAMYYTFWYGERPFVIRHTARTIILNSVENYGVYFLILLLDHVYRYYTRFRQGELRATQLQTKLAQAQLQALKMQLHPHFLFNTLHSISSLVHKDPEAADRMISRLGDFLRMTLDNTSAQEVNLRQELEFLRCYLEIERIRFQDRLTTEMEIDPRALDTPVPNLILQPIVENAIRHGVAPRSTPGRIEIQAKQKNGTLRIEVRDNGPGLPRNLSADNLFRKGLGLANTKARLEQLYGGEYRLELAERPGGGLAVTMEIPAAASTTGRTDPSNN